MALTVNGCASRSAQDTHFWHRGVELTADLAGLRALLFEILPMPLVRAPIFLFPLRTCAGPGNVGHVIADTAGLCTLLVQIRPVLLVVAPVFLFPSRTCAGPGLVDANTAAAATTATTSA